MAPILSFLISSGSKKKEPRYVCLSEAKASLRLKICYDMIYDVISYCVGALHRWS